MKDVVKKVLEISGFSSLNPVQEKSIKKGLLEGKNLVIFAPTSSGKTLIAEISAVKTILQDKKKVVYLVPLVALANEKYDVFKKKYEKIGIKVAISVGDYDSSDPWLKKYDFIITTNEKMDSLIRHDADWIRDIGLIIADEIHLLTDPSRGPTLEVVLTLLKEIVPNSQILALSATIKNANELAEWLNAEPVVSSWRPVKLYKGILVNSKIKIYNKGIVRLDENLEGEAALTKNILKRRKQILFFVSTRKKAESLASKLSALVSKYTTQEETEKLKKVSLEIETVLDTPTLQCKKLSTFVKKGIAFHHSGLLYKQRKIIEKSFREGLIKLIVATPSLAYGVNLPSFVVVIRDLKRYYPGIGSMYIPVLEVEQMLGRAGRVDYDDFGIGILFSKTEHEAATLEETYILGEPEDITSKLSLEPILRMYVLSLISLGFCNSLESLLNFFSKTFYAKQFSDFCIIEEKIERILEDLKDWGFIKEKDNKVVAATIGKRISELYLDPLTGYKLINGIKKAAKRKTNEFSFISLAAWTREFYPYINIKTKEIGKLEEELEKRRHKLITDIPEEWDYDYDEFLKSFKLALVFEAWINEKTESFLLSTFGITPGDFWSKLQTMDWILYSIQEIAYILGLKELIKTIKKTRLRVKHGVKEELLRLVKLEKIGRIRARKLFDNNIKTISDIRKVPIEVLSRILGPKIALDVKKQVGGLKQEQKILS